jgi:hypothetical protein
MSDTIKLTGALSPREKGYREGYENGLEDGRSKASEWIPVSERFPEVGPTGCVYVLASFENAIMPDIARYERDDDGSGAFYPGEEERSYMSHGIIVNAWMPLPKQYREEDEK